MKIQVHDNRASVNLDPGESFYFKGSILTGFPKFDWCFPPPHPFGSPIMRLFYRSYFGMKKVSATDGPMEIPLTGVFPRGNFQEIEIPDGKKYYINTRHLAGFCGKVREIHTHIKFHPVFWFLREHFFTVVHGPGKVLLYGNSRFEWREDFSFETDRIMCFDISRRLTTTTPQPEKLLSLIWNIISSTTYWQFVDPGKTLVETHHNVQHSEKLSFKEIVMHFLTFLKF